MRTILKQRNIESFTNYLNVNLLEYNNVANIYLDIISSDECHQET